MSETTLEMESGGDPHKPYWLTPRRLITCHVFLNLQTQLFHEALFLTSWSLFLAETNFRLAVLDSSRPHPDGVQEWRRDWSAVSTEDE